MGVEEVLRAFDTSPNGLSSEEASRRAINFGPNELPKPPKDPLWKKFVRQFKDLIVVVLLVSAVVSAVVGVAEGEGASDTIVIVTILLLNATIGTYQEAKAEKAVESLSEMAADKVRVLRDGGEVELPTRELIPGDIVFVEAGDRVPADGRIVTSMNLKVEEGALTGESVPVEKGPEPVNDPKAALADRRDVVYSGTTVSYGKATVVVTATGPRTEIGKIADLLAQTEETETPLSKSLAKVGKQLTGIILVVCAVVFVVSIAAKGAELGLRGATVEAVLVAISLAVAAVPEGLPAIVTTTLSLGAIRLAERNAIVKNLRAVETLGCTTVICSDKTGTLTKNEMTVRRVFTTGRLFDVTGTGYLPAGEIQKHGLRVDRESAGEALLMTIKVGALCNTSRLFLDEEGRWSVAGDPTEGALLVLADKTFFKVEELRAAEPQVWEFPFDSKRKLMTTGHRVGDRVFLYTKGAPEKLMVACDKIHEKRGAVVPMTAQHRDLIRHVIDGLSKQALRCLGMAYRELPGDVDLDSREPTAWESGLTWAGMVAMIDPARDEAKEAIRKCRKAGIRVKMITGDYEVTAHAIAQELGIAEPGEPYLTGSDIDSASRDQLREVKVFARASPENKITIVDALQEDREVVAMTGDGVNDAPALKKADVGVGMGITGTDVSLEAADLVLADDNFATIVAAVEEGRAIYANMKKFIQFLTSSNVGEILIIFVGLLVFGSTPLVATQILWINLVTDGFPAIALGFEPADADIMDRPPRDPNHPIIDREMKKTILLVGVVMMATTLGAFAITRHINVAKLSAEVAAGGLALTQAEIAEIAVHRANAVAFCTTVVLQMVNVLNCRTEGSLFAMKDKFRNPTLIFAILLSLGLQFAVVYTPGLNEVFHVAPMLASDRPVLVWGDWLVIGAMSLVLLLAVEVEKRVSK
ncbi:MAG: calcium-transporting P-type ATPase, PMR1-type [Promethearchaeota archaeon]